MVNVATDLVDDRSRIVLLLPGREALALIEHHLLLRGRGRALFRFGNRRDELGAPAVHDDLLRRLALRIELPVSRGVRIRRVQDGLVKKGVRHDDAPRAAGECPDARLIRHRPPDRALDSYPAEWRAFLIPLSATILCQSRSKGNP